MSRPPLSFEVWPDDARPHHLHVMLYGTLDDRVGVAEALEKLAERLCQGIVTVAIIYADQVGVVSGGAERWIAFMKDVPASIQFVYQPSQLSMIMQDFDDDEYLRRHSTHVHLDNYVA